ncbi:MAG: MipA/OmpV family protein [Agarilytica sp.]
MVFGCATAIASESSVKPCQPDREECVTVGSWEFSLAVGLGGRTNPIVEQDDQPIILLPSVNYYGKRFFLQTDTLGVTLLDASRHQLNLILTPSYEQVYFKDISIGNFSLGGNEFSGSSGSSGSGSGSGSVVGINDGLPDDLDLSWVSPSPTPSPEVSPTPVPSSTPVPSPTPAPSPTPEPTPVVGVSFDSGLDVLAEEDIREIDNRDTAALFGFEYLAFFDPFSFGLQVLGDISSVHEGMQVRTFASLHTKLSERQGIEWLIGGEWRDQKIHDYYFGVQAHEVNDTAFVYEADSGFSPYAKIHWYYDISEQWQLTFVLDHRKFSEEISNSPLVKDDSSSTVFLGGIYHF